MGGVKLSDLKELVAPGLAQLSDPLLVKDDGLATASINAYTRLNTTNSQPTLNQPADLDYYIVIDIVDAKAGVAIDVDQVALDVSGQPAKKTAAALRRQPGYDNVVVEMSPFWAIWRTYLPTSPDNITVKINNIDN